MEQNKKLCKHEFKQKYEDELHEDKFVCIKCGIEKTFKLRGIKDETRENKNQRP